MNQYQIGDKIKYRDENGNLKDGTIYEIKAPTKRHNASSAHPGYSEIINTAEMGYKCLGSCSRVRGRDILGVIARNQYT
jgi:hypothetical protein